MKIFIFLIFIQTAFSLETKLVLENSGVIWGFDFLSENEILYTKKSGEVIYQDLQKGIARRVQVVPVISGGQAGLLDLKLKKIGKTQYVYVTFSENNFNDTITSLGRFELENRKGKNFETLFKAKVKSKTSRHFGSRLYIGDDHLFMTIGDRGERKYVQDLSYHNGKIVRLSLDGKAKGAKIKNALPEIWSYGHRNPQGITYDSENKKLYSIEFGPKGGDELNLIEEGKNYGWPEITYGKEYYGMNIGETHKVGMEQPLVYWTPSISPSGIIFYQGDKIPGWKDSLIVAALGSMHIRRLEIDGPKIGKQEVFFKNLNERIRHVESSPEGNIYFCTDSGKVYKIIP
jgi:glucose/arabinose dehydrogenase